MKREPSGSFFYLLKKEQVNKPVTIRVYIFAYIGMLIHTKFVTIPS